MVRKRSREEQDEYTHVTKKPLIHRATVLGRNGVWVVSSTRPLASKSASFLHNHQPINNNRSTQQRRGGKSSVSKQLESWAQMKEDKLHENCIVQTECSDVSSAEVKDANNGSSGAKLASIQPNAGSYHARRVNAIIICQMASFFVMIIFLIVSVAYTQFTSQSFLILQNEALFEDTVIEYNSILQQKERIYQNVKSQVEIAAENARQQQAEMAKSEQSYKMLIDDYKAIAQQHDDDKNAALSRIAALRSQKEDSSSALDLAWLRMDDLLHENNELSSLLKRTKKKLERNIDYLTLERDKLLQGRDALDERNKLLHAQNELQQYTHEYAMNMFFAPMLTHAINLQQTSEHQHSVIVELTSIVRSLNESLENSEIDLGTQIVIAQAQSKVYEMERLSIMENMKLQIAQLEEEAIGAVNAVATASGKLELERKTEEQLRWNEYVSQVENILGDMSTETGEGIVETSVLRATITRKVETGLNMLKRYVHPCHFVNKRDDDHIFTMEIEA